MILLLDYYYDLRLIKINFIDFYKNVVGVCYNKKYELYVSICINCLIVD